MDAIIQTISLAVCVITLATSLIVLYAYPALSYYFARRRLIGNCVFLPADVNERSSIYVTSCMGRCDKSYRRANPNHGYCTAVQDLLDEPFVCVNIKAKYLYNMADFTLMDSSLCIFTVRTFQPTTTRMFSQKGRASP
jgi:hypothetical protein